MIIMIQIFVSHIMTQIVIRIVIQIINRDTGRDTNRDTDTHIITSPIERALIRASTILVLVGGVWGGVCPTHSTASAIVSFVVFVSSTFQHSIPAVHLYYGNC